ncbi:MAG: TetR/AcrR family transcriptional regulator [Acidimicrobiia bacterium]
MSIPTSAARRPGRRPDERLSEAVIDATLGLLAEHGYDGLSIEAIARRAGVSRPTIYKRWRSLSNLVLDAARRSRDLGPVFPEGIVAIPDTGTLRGDLLAIARDGVELLGAAERQDFLNGLFAGIAADPALGPTYREGFLDPDYYRLQVIFKRARARGELRDDLDPGIGLEMLVAFGFYRMRIIRDPLTDEVLETVVDVIVRGLAGG